MDQIDNVELDFHQLFDFHSFDLIVNHHHLLVIYKLHQLFHLIFVHNDLTRNINEVYKLVVFFF